jgi:hypothetical protein
MVLLGLRDGLQTTRARFRSVSGATSWGKIQTEHRFFRREVPTIWIADAHRDDGKRFVVRADEKLTAFLELERAVCIHLLSEQC